MTDPGPEYWQRQSAQLPVINAMRALIDQEPDRCTGVTTYGSDRLTLHIVDPTMRDDHRLVALLADAQAADIAVEIAESPRTLRELNAIKDEVYVVVRTQRVRAGRITVHPATSSVHILVADSAVDAIRGALARFGEAVLVTGNGPVDLTMRLHRYTGPRDGWPVPTLPTDQAAGRPADDVAELYRSEGFAVGIHHLGDPVAFTADLRPDRIRLLVHDRHVVDATQG